MLITILLLIGVAIVLLLAISYFITTTFFKFSSSEDVFLQEREKQKQNLLTHIKDEKDRVYFIGKFDMATKRTLLARQKVLNVTKNYPIF
jgi:hypothetical protein